MWDGRLRVRLSEASDSPASTGRPVESVRGLRSVDAVFVDAAARVVSVPKSLEGQEVLAGDIRHVGVVEVDWVVAWVVVSPAIVLQSVEPVVVVRGVDGSAALMVARARSSSQADSTHAIVVPTVEQVLLSRGAEGRVQSDIVIHRLSSADEIAGSARLQVAGEGAVNPIRV
jgi:hypothetical protein